MEQVDNCVICGQPLAIDGPPTVTLGEKGSAGVNDASEQRNDSIQTVRGQRVHIDCRSRYINPNYITQAIKDDKQTPGTSTGHTLRRPVEQSFNYRSDCFLCGTPVLLDEQNRRHVDFSEALTLKVKKHTIRNLQKETRCMV